MTLYQTMTYQDYRKAQEFIRSKSSALMKHEEKDFAKISFPYQNYTEFHIKGRIFYCAMTSPFLHIFRSVLLQAIDLYPEKFGTGNAMDVIDAIHRVEPLFFDLPRYAEYLGSEQFGYAMENKNGVIQDRVLRIDLYRHLKLLTESNSHEFVGGIFHALKHFSFRGTNLSTGTDINDVIHPREVIAHTIKAFFIEEEEFVNPNEFRARLNLDEKYNLRFAFYYEPKTSVHFIKTIFKEARKKKSGT